MHIETRGASLLDEALRLAELGYPVFPCAPGKKVPMTKSGFKDATTDPKVIRAWWEKWPNANLGLPTRGLVVIDVDDPQGPWMQDHGADLASSAGACAHTPSTGMHFVFRDEGPAYRSCSVCKIAPGVDVRADGGYIVVSPSTVDGKTYIWERPLEERREELKTVPLWLGDLLNRSEASSTTHGPSGRKHRASRDATAGDEVSLIPEGLRNDTLTRMAGALRRKGLSGPEIEAALQEINRRRCTPCLEESEVTSIAHSISKYPSGVMARSAMGLSNREKQPDIPDIVIATDEHRVVDEAVAALAKDPAVFCRGSVLVRIQQPELAPGGHSSRSAIPIISPLAMATLRERLTKHANLLRTKQDELVPAHPPGWLVGAIEARGQWPGVRTITGVADAPVLRPDGSVWDQPGYDAKTGVFLVPSGEYPPLPDAVRPEHGVEAVKELREVIADFSFQSPAHESAWVAYLLTIIGRFAFEGCSPLFLIDANIRGAGKGLLAQVASVIATGMHTAVSSAPNEVEETRKVITTFAISGDRVVLFDNVEGKLGNEALDRALTCTQWRDRLLGTSNHICLPLTPVWVATGNNVIVAADTARRIVPIRLDCMCEKPEDRTGFKHPNLLEYVARNRVRLYTAGLTILAAYMHAGGPSVGLQPYGSFEGWSDIVRSAVVYAGMVDPCAGRKQLAEQSDSSHEALVTLIELWGKIDPKNAGVVVGKLLADLYASDTSLLSKDDTVLVRAAIESLPGVHGGGKVPTARQVGNALRRYRKRVINGVYLDTDATSEVSAGKKWRRFDADSQRPLTVPDGGGGGT
ncbi:MAG: bifunctional DNA primase/polymerase [Phycisphaerales bacterium]|nr:bifunctional DNA primase/polymerase [Phycisphaerales bacterium]